MIIEKLREKTDLTHSETILADYILANTELVMKMNIRELADAAYVSAPTVTRLCQKIGDCGFNDFKVTLSREYSDTYQKMTTIDDNYPFGKNDSPQEIINKLARGSINAIVSSRDGIDLKAIMQVIRAIEKRRIIDIYGTGYSTFGAESFAMKMTRIGYPTTVISEEAMKYARAHSSTESQFAIIISYSGLLGKYVDYMQALNASNTPILLITGNPLSPLISYARYVIQIKNNESVNMNDKIDTISSQISLHFVLDCIYSLVFAQHFEENRNKSHNSTPHDKKMII